MEKTSSAIIGAATPLPGEIGLVINVGGTLYMVTGCPTAIETVVGRLTVYASVLAKQTTPENDDLLGEATIGVGRGGGQDFITGPYNAIAAIRSIILTKAA